MNKGKKIKDNVIKVLVPQAKPFRSPSNPSSSWSPYKYHNVDQVKTSQNQSNSANQQENMKREGRQHGTFTKAPSKPSNHSKFTGKSHPSFNSKDKIKGANKLQSHNVELRYDEIVVLRVRGKDHGEVMPADRKLKLDRCSAWDLLDQIETSYLDFDDRYDQ